MQCGRPVQKNRVLTNDLSENIPNLRRFALDHLLGGFNRTGQSSVFEFAKDKRLKELQCHFLRESALMQPECRSSHDHRSTGVVNALTQQVLTETPLLAFNHVSQ